MKFFRGLRQVDNTELISEVAEGGIPLPIRRMEAMELLNAMVQHLAMKRWFLPFIVRWWILVGGGAASDLDGAQLLYRESNTRRVEPVRRPLVLFVGATARLAFHNPSPLSSAHDLGGLEFSVGATLPFPACERGG